VNALPCVIEVAEADLWWICLIGEVTSFVKASKSPSRDSDEVQVLIDRGAMQQSAS
jgi:hypothetical protein